MDPLDDGWDIFCKIIEPSQKPRLEIESAKGKGKKKVHLSQSQCDLVTTHWRNMVDLGTLHCGYVSGSFTLAGIFTNDYYQLP
jgi:hypothetical protein